ncbi:hypothetical protein TNCV_1220081 [Trichonephila clavipes]|nr:hypothetical protein TNCV_1220081 [Trichonephila clavipes]
MSQEVDSDDVKELLDFYNQELTIDELLEIQDQDIEELEFLDAVQSGYRIMDCHGWLGCSPIWTSNFR